MSTYNERLQANNADLEKLTADVNALPDQKEEQEKTVSVTDNGAVVVTPDTGKALSKATVNVNVPTGGGGNIKTCLVTVTGGTPVPPPIPPKTGIIAYTTVMKGEAVLVVSDRKLTGVQTIPMVCGTMVFAQRNTGSAAGFSGSGWQEIIITIPGLKGLPDTPTDGLEIDIS